MSVTQMREWIKEQCANTASCAAVIDSWPDDTVRRVFYRMNIFKK